MKTLDKIVLPDDRRYTDEHIWIKKDGDSYLCGISDFAQDQLGEVVYIELPSAGDTFDAGVPYGEVESIKSVNKLFTPVKAEVIAANTALEDAPATLNEDCYTTAWIVRLKVENEADIDGLLTADAYRAFLNK